MVRIHRNRYRLMVLFADATYTGTDLTSSDLLGRDYPLKTGSIFYEKNTAKIWITSTQWRGSWSIDASMTPGLVHPAGGNIKAIVLHHP